MLKLFCVLSILFQSVLLCAQNTGIGITTPVEKLDVNGAIRIGNTSTVNQGTIRYNGGRFEGLNNLSRWEYFGVPPGSLITVADTTGLLGRGFTIYGKQAVNIQQNFGLGQGRWLSPVTVMSGVGFNNTAGVWSGSEILVYYNNFIYRLNTSTNTWAQSSMNTVGGFVTRFGYSAVWTGSEIIIFGGFNGSNALNTGVRYNPSTNTWTAIANCPVKRLDHSAIFKGTEMIVFGGDSIATSGTCSGPGFSSNQVWKYDIGTNTWTGPSVVSGSIPAARRNHIAGWTGTEMIIYGGSRTSDGTCNGGNIPLNDVYTFNPTTSAWTLKSGIPGFTSAIGAWNGSRLLIWGSNMFDGVSYPLGVSYDPVLNNWSYFPNDGAIRQPANSFSVWNSSGLHVVEDNGYQVYDASAGFSNVYYFPVSRTLYVLEKN
jgi:hypothetical protein